MRRWPSDSDRARLACAAATVCGSSPDSNRAASAHACSELSRAITCRRMPNVSVRPNAAARLRMSGSTGVDLAFTAAGTYNGAITFGSHAWDNVGGAALVRAAGGIVTDVAGEQWTVSSPSLVAAAPGVHGELIELIDSVTGQEWEI